MKMIKDIMAAVISLAGFGITNGNHGGLGWSFLGIIIFICGAALFCYGKETND